MENTEKCPVCNTENNHTYYCDEGGLTEDYYTCENCGYFRQMAYSPIEEGIKIPSTKTYDEIIKLHSNKIHELKLKVFKEVNDDFQNRQIEGGW